MESDLSLWYIQVDTLKESFGLIGLKHGSETRAEIWFCVMACKVTAVSLFS